MKTASLIVAFFGFSLGPAGSLQAADHVVKMLTASADGGFVFDPAYIKVAPGDTVVFTPTEKGAHYPVSLLLPAGAKAFRGQPDQEFKLKVEKEGVYLYYCEPHKPLGMVGVIQVGKPVNLAEAKVVATREQAGFAVGKDRFDKALAQVK